jgi:hypothetical protein
MLGHCRRKLFCDIRVHVKVVGLLNVSNKLGWNEGLTGSRGYERRKERDETSRDVVRARELIRYVGESD